MTRAINTKYLDNLETLLNTRSFYFVEANADGWSVYLDKTSSCGCLGEKLDLRAAMKLAFDSRAENKHDNPILLFGIGHEFLKDMPIGVFLSSGEVKTLGQGYYLVPMNDKPREELILECFSPQNMEEPETHYIFEDYERKHAQRNYREVFGLDFGYIIHKCQESKSYLVAFQSEGNISNCIEFPSLKAAAKSILEDQSAINTNYPVIIRDRDNQPRYAVTDLGNVKRILPGYYLIAHDGLTSEDAIEKFILAETSKVV